jgi:hypothetical protein
VTGADAAGQGGPEGLRWQLEQPKADRGGVGREAEQCIALAAWPVSSDHNRPLWALLAGLWSSERPRRVGARLGSGPLRLRFAVSFAPGVVSPALEQFSSEPTRCFAGSGGGRAGGTRIQQLGWAKQV